MTPCLYWAVDRLLADLDRRTFVVRRRRYASTFIVILRLVFALLNVRSVANKLDDLLDVRRDLAIDVLFLVETWHAARR